MLVRGIFTNTTFSLLSHSPYRLVAYRQFGFFASRQSMGAVKRGPGSLKADKPSKKPKVEQPAYHLTPTVKDENGDPIWPAPRVKMEQARDFIIECAKAGKTTMIVPDKDADGLTSGVILYRTLVLLGLPEDLIKVHLLRKGTATNTPEEREAMANHNPAYIFILDQGSRKGPPVIDKAHKALVIDHHYAEEGDFPENAQFITACNSPPVATSSLLTYILCNELHSQVSEQCDWLCAIGTHGDLGTTLKWEDPFPDMHDMFKKYTKKNINDAVSALNAPRRTSKYDVVSAWDALISATDPKSIIHNRRLNEARQEISLEVERCTHTAPKFSYDGKIAVFRISSEAQVHPVIATRWSGHLTSSKLEFVMVANEGYLPGLVNFSCRIVRSARSRDPPVNIIESLREIASRDPAGTLTERLGESFARGHKEASGGIVGVEQFEELMSLMRVGEKPEKKDDESPKKQKVSLIAQKNKLTNYFGKA